MSTNVSGKKPRDWKALTLPIVLSSLIVLILFFYAYSYFHNRANPSARSLYKLSDLVMPTLYEPLVGLDLGGMQDSGEILISESPDIDVIRAELRSGPQTPPDKDAPAGGTLLICDFDKDGVTEREFTCPVGSWISDPTDPTIKFLEAYDPIYRLGEKGYCLKLWYDIESPNPAFGGLWVQFKPSQQQLTIDLSDYRYLVMYIRGSSSAIGFTSRIRIEMKNEAEVATATVTGITGKWQRFEVPLSQFKNITDWTRMKEMTVVLAADVVDKREGLLYFDDLGFTR